MYRNDPLEIGRQDAANQYLRYADAGTVAMAILLALVLVGESQLKSVFGASSVQVVHVVKGLCALTLFVVLMTLFKKSLRDEYIEGMWHAGTAAGFAAGVTYEFAAGFVASAAADYAAASGRVLPDWVELLPGQAMTVAIVAFFVAFQIKRRRAS